MRGKFGSFIVGVEKSVRHTITDVAIKGNLLGLAPALISMPCLVRCLSLLPPAAPKH